MRSFLLIVFLLLLLLLVISTFAGYGKKIAPYIPANQTPKR
ncbi:hypothetical protein [Polluticoccus soli]|nr:hypothetical protein [Flavipsychrobacter sp. JY13-12]